MSANGLSIPWGRFSLRWLLLGIALGILLPASVSRIYAVAGTATFTGTGSIYFLDSSGNTTGRFEAKRQVDTGDGADGAITISVNKNINTDTLAANAWDGTKGGVLFYRANGTVTVNGTMI